MDSRIRFQQLAGTAETQKLGDGVCEKFGGGGGGFGATINHQQAQRSHQVVESPGKPEVYSGRKVPTRALQSARNSAICSERGSDTELWGAVPRHGVWQGQGGGQQGEPLAGSPPWRGGMLAL